MAEVAEDLLPISGLITRLPDPSHTLRVFCEFGRLAEVRRVSPYAPEIGNSSQGRLRAEIARKHAISASCTIRRTCSCW